MAIPAGFAATYSLGGGQAATTYVETILGIAVIGAALGMFMFKGGGGGGFGRTRQSGRGEGSPPGTDRDTQRYMGYRWGDASKATQQMAQNCAQYGRDCGKSALRGDLPTGPPFRTGAPFYGR
jgi:hypothetical protein